MQKIAERNNYKRDKDYKNADSIRDELNKLWIGLKDTSWWTSRSINFIN
jgi:cysteinyl-tRNA synthetase